MFVLSDNHTIIASKFFLSRKKWEKMHGLYSMRDIVRVGKEMVYGIRGMLWQLAVP